MVLEQRSLGSRALPTHPLYGVSGQEERHVCHTVVTFAGDDLPRDFSRLWVRISTNLREAIVDGKPRAFQILLAPAVASGIELGTRFVIRIVLMCSA